MLHYSSRHAIMTTAPRTEIMATWLAYLFHDSYNIVAIEKIGTIYFVSRMATSWDPNDWAS